jgi:protein-S-isoprenylcysteine O-methyltransferase Ste14
LAAIALLLLTAWLVIVAGARSYLQLRRTGNPGVAFHDRRGSPQWWARLISTLGLVCAFAAPIAEISGLPPAGPLDEPIVDLVGVGLVIVGIALTLVAQWAMGESWRADVDDSARTKLVTTGPFRFVRNPILTATAITAFGIALIVPNVLTALMLVTFLAAHQIQVRLVEEPYLLRVHGQAYRDYGTRTGRFVPWIGRFPPRS